MQKRVKTARRVAYVASGILIMVPTATLAAHKPWYLVVTILLTGAVMNTVALGLIDRYIQADSKQFQ